MGGETLHEGVEWRMAEKPVAYDHALQTMEERVAGILDGVAGELVWLLEHPPLITAGTSASYADVRQPGRFPVFETGRGGKLTYHGPGQRVAYVMLDLRKRGSKPDLRRYVHDLEAWIILTLEHFGVKGERREGRVGIWVKENPYKESKIAAIGVRVRRWVTYHGIALNIRPDLGHFDAIVPCGIRQHGVTSLEALGIEARLDEVDTVLRQAFATVFGATSPDEPLAQDGREHHVRT